MLLSGAFPRELSDFLAIGILALTGIETIDSQIPVLSVAKTGIILLLVSLTTSLAALSDSSKRQREELALFAYGGTAWQIQMRYVLRGNIIVALGLLPFLFAQLSTILGSPVAILTLLLFIAWGGIAYAVPGLRRTKSLEFVEQYKG